MFYIDRRNHNTTKISNSILVTSNPNQSSVLLESVTSSNQAILLSSHQQVHKVKKTLKAAKTLPKEVTNVTSSDCGGGTESDATTTPKVPSLKSVHFSKQYEIH
jgi:hypothetical protein